MTIPARCSAARRRTNVPFAILLLAITVGFVGCSTSFRSQRVESEEPFEDVWNALLRISAQHGYPMHHGLSDRGLRLFVSRWNELPAPFGRGKRTRLHAEFTRLEERPGWALEFYIQKQIVEDMSRGFEPAEDDWSDSGQETVREEIILGQLRSALGQQLEMGPSWEGGR